MKTLKRTTFLVTLALAAFSTGCVGGPSNGSKAGGSGEAVVLRMADAYASLDYEPAIAYYVQRVAELSGNRVRIAVTHRWGNFEPDLEQRVVRDTASGVVDLGWSGSRVFDTLGVRSFQALTAPMLIDNYVLQNAVIDSDLPAQMLRDLGRVGVTGLGVFADGLRKPVGVQYPLLGPADYRGITFWSIRSDGQRQAVLALGATPADEIGPGSNRDAAIERGEIHGFEMNLITYNHNLGWQRAPYLTANVNLWPQPTVVFANTNRMAALSEQQRNWLRQAAREAVTRSKDLANHDSELVAQACAAGARPVNATEADLAALRHVLAPVTAILAQDPQTNTFIIRIEELKESTTAEAAPTIPANCASPATPRIPAATSTSPAQLDGTYRWILTPLDAVLHGTQNDKTPTGLSRYPTTFTVTLTNGRWHMSQSGSSDTGSGTYTVNGDQLTFDWSDKHDKLTFTYISNSAGDVSLQPIEPMDAGDHFVWATKTWTKIR
jgi:TRAP-type C4-dicarboxylate transport system substrate-binding protein